MSRIHLLDTNVFSAWVNGEHERHAAVVEKAAELGDSFVYLSAVTVAEVQYGLACPHRLTAEIVGQIQQALLQFPVLDIDRHVGEPYGELRAWLRAKYAPKKKRLRSLAQLEDTVNDMDLQIQENDLWLASQAIATDSILVTEDQGVEVIREAAEATGCSLLTTRW